MHPLDLDFQGWFRHPSAAAEGFPNSVMAAWSHGRMVDCTAPVYSIVAFVVPIARRRP
jgi:hypothetical protein